MGHRLDTHEVFYRLSDDAFQKAKLGKLLLCLEKGNVEQFKKKKIDTVEIIDDVLLETQMLEIDFDNTSSETDGTENHKIKSPKLKSNQEERKTQK